MNGLLVVYKDFMRSGNLRFLGRGLFVIVITFVIEEETVYKQIVYFNACAYRNLFNLW